MARQPWFEPRSLSARARAAGSDASRHRLSRILPAMLAELDTLEGEALHALAATSDDAAVEAWRIDWLGTKGRLKGLMGRMKDVDPADRPAFGQRVNALKQTLNAAFEQRKAEAGQDCSGPPLDVTEPGTPTGLGRRHIISRTLGAPPLLVLSASRWERPHGL